MPIRTTLIGAAKLAAIGVVALTTFAHAAQYAGGPASPERGAPGFARGAAHAFKISGHVKNLFPGRTTKLVTTVRNPNAAAIRVTLVKAKVTGAPGCPAKNVKIKPFKGKRYVGAGRTVKVKLKITMRAKAPNACQGDKLHLRYHGKAVRA